MNIEMLLNKYGLNVKKFTLLRDNVVYVEDEFEEAKIFKRKRTESNGNWINDHRFFNEIRIYESLQNGKFNYLNTPKLLSTTEESLIIQYVEKCQKSKININDFIGSYFELQTLAVPRKFWFDFKNQLLRGFIYKGVIVPLFTLRRKIGIINTIKVIALFLKLNLTTKKLKDRYWLHGDIAGHNIYYNKTDNKLYFIDFENMFYTRKWIFTEVIPFCIGLKPGGMAFTFDIKNFNLYISHMQRLKDINLKKINLKKHFRFSLLMLCISNTAAAKSEIKRNSYIFLLNTVLNKQLFDIWYAKNVKNKVTISSSRN